MPKKSYNQFCPIAYALDLVGDRWTILIIRELLYGPRRFTDIQRGLPGLATNLLSQRLKDMEESGFIQQRDLPPPAAATVYELTAYGNSTRMVVDSLTMWGIHRMISGSLQEHHLSVAATVNALKVLFDKAAARDVMLSVEGHAAGEVFSATLNEGNLSLSLSPAQSPDLIVAGDTKTLLSIVVGVVDIAQAIDAGMVKIQQGTVDDLRTFADCFGFPDPTVPE